MATILQSVPVREKVLENAGLREAETLLDVGTGDGLIAFGALERVGRGGKVIFSDISFPSRSTFNSASLSLFLSRASMRFGSSFSLAPPNESRMSFSFSPAFAAGVA